MAEREIPVERDMSRSAASQAIQRDSQPGPSHIVQAEDICIYTDEEET